MKMKTWITLAVVAATSIGAVMAAGKKEKNMTDNSKEIVLAYHDAFYRDDRAAVRSLLADRGDFIGPLNSFTDADTFLYAADFFMNVMD
jgi:hypothetical protein